MATEYEYVKDSASLKERYDRLTNIINALEEQMLSAASNTDKEEYKFNDGQIKIEMAYRSPDAIAKSIITYERLRNMVLNQLCGLGVVRLNDASGLLNNGRLY